VQIAEHEVPVLHLAHVGQGGGVARQPLAAVARNSCGMAWLKAEGWTSRWQTCSNSRR
jgi:hypothetical protein